MARGDAGGEPAGALPGAPLGGWFGYASYDTVRYAEPERLGWDAAPRDDRGLPDLDFALHDEVVVFDHVAKIVHAVRLVVAGEGEDPVAAYDLAAARLGRRSRRCSATASPAGRRGGPRHLARGAELRSNITRDEHRAMVERAREYIREGDIFQVVLGQRFERRSAADPFDVYRALRVVNPSPYMVYLQSEGCILVASSPEILCRVRREGGAADGAGAWW